MSEYENKAPAEALKHLCSGDNDDSPTSDQIDAVWRRAAADPDGRDVIMSMAEEDPTTVVDMLIWLLTVATGVMIAINL